MIRSSSGRPWGLVNDDISSACAATAENICSIFFCSLVLISSLNVATVGKGKSHF